MHRVQSRGRVLFRALTLLLLVSVPLMAQFDRGQISGFVKDPTGAFVPGATVIVTNEATNLSKNTITDSNGYYIVPGLDVSNYTVAVEMTGFKKHVKQSIKVDANAKVALEVTLELGNQSETVTVTAGTTELQSDTATLGRIVDRKSIEDLVVFGRNPLNLVRLKAGVRGGGTSGGDSLTDGGFNIAGSRGDENNIFVDGAVATRTRSAGSQIGFISADTVQEMQVLTTNYNAEYGRTAGGQIRFITRGGSSQFHGSAFENFRNSALNTNTWQRNKSTDFDTRRRAAPFRHNQFGFDIGGPVYIPGHLNSDRNKLFFYYEMEWIRNRSEGLRTALFPTLAMRRGDFSELLATSAFFSGSRIINDPVTGQPFPNNVIPTSRLSANGIGFLKSLPEPTPGFNQAGANYIETNANLNNYGKQTVKVDWLPAATHRISFRGSLFQQHQIGRTEENFRPNRTAALSWTWSARSNLINELTASPSLDIVHIDIAPSNLARWQQRSKYGINYPYLFPNTKERDDKVPTLSISGVSDNDGSRLPLYSAGPIYVVTDNVTWIKRTHTFKFGLYMERSGENDFDQINVQTVPGATNNQNGRFEFRDNRPNGTNLALGNAALGLFSNYAEISRRAYTPWRSTAWEFFAQDSWKARQNFTLEYGVRYVLWPPWHSLWGNIAQFDPLFYDKSKAAVVSRTTGAVLSGDLYNGVVLPGSSWPDAANGRVNVAADRSFDRLFHGLPEGLAPTHKNVFEPRLGMAYSLNSKTVVRSGVGMFHNRTLLNDSTLLGGNPPIQPIAGASDGLADTPGGTGAVPNVFPFLMTANPYSYEHPTAWAWNLMIQRQLPWDFTIETGYVGRRAYKQPRERNINQLLPGTRQANPGVNTEALRPYVGMGIIRASEHVAQADYHGLQTEVNRRFSHGIQFGLAYTFSKLTSTADNKRDILPNAYDDRNFTGLSGNDRRHLLIFSYVYELPFLKDRSQFLGKAFGGWQLSGITEYRSGSPLLAGWVGDDNAGVGTGSGSQPWNLVGDPYSGASGKFSEGVLGGVALDQNSWFNGCARQSNGTLGASCAPGASPLWAFPTLGTFGSAGRNIVIGPGFYNYDLGITKRFTISEGKTLQVRGEMFNFLNHPNLDNPQLNPTNANFGRATAKTGNRDIQISLQFRF
jgi:hypothetical protein